MRRFVVAAVLVAAVGLSACQSAQVDASIQSTLAAVCPVADQAHAAFTIVATRSERAAEYADEERQAYAAVSVACSNPSAVTSQNVLVYVAAAYAAWEVAGVL